MPANGLFLLNARDGPRCHRSPPSGALARPGCILSRPLAFTSPNATAQIRSGVMIGASWADPPALQAEHETPARDERSLIAQAQRDPRAFAPLYADYFEPVFRYCLRCLGDREAAADATQEIFARVLAALPRYQERAFRPWLFTIAHNVIVDIHRRRGRRPAEVPLEAAARRPQAIPTPEEEAIAADARQTVRRYLAQLPADQRAVIELRLADLKGQEVADALACSLGTVKITQHRALRRLRELMASADAEGGTDGTI
jgi:RNA polymerase sigma-70 factor (ECF subfamily)